MTKIPQQARHMRIGHLGAHARLLDLLLRHLGRHDRRRRLVRRRQQVLFQILDRGRRIGQAGFVPDGLELAVELDVQARVVGPDHLRGVVLLVAHDEQLVLLFHLVDCLFHVGPAFLELLDAETLRRALGLEEGEQLDVVADVVEGAEAIGAFAVEVGGVVVDFVVLLQDLGDRLLFSFVAILEGEIAEQVVQGLRRGLLLEVLDGVGNVRHDFLPFARVCWLGVDDVGGLGSFALEIGRGEVLLRCWRSST